MRIRALALTLVAVAAVSCARVDVDTSTGGGGAAATEQGQVELRVVTGPGGGTLAFVPVFVNDEGPFLFALDTGASSSVIDTEVASQLQLETIGDAGQVTGVTGSTTATLVRFDSWRAGDVELPGNEATVLDMPEPQRGHGLQGLLGSDVLQQFEVITVNYEQQLLTLGRRRAPSPSPSPT